MRIYNENSDENEEIYNFVLEGYLVFEEESTQKILNFEDFIKNNSNKKTKTKIIPITNNINIESLKEINEDKINLIFYAFDILILNDRIVYDQSLENRRFILTKIFSDFIKEIQITKSQIINLNPVDIAENKIINFFQEANKFNCNSISFKFLGSFSKYNFNNKAWFKVCKLTIINFIKLNKKNKLFIKDQFYSKEKKIRIKSNSNSRF